jgi:hypothetical protein
MTKVQSKLRSHLILILLMFGSFPYGYSGAFIPDSVHRDVIRIDTIRQLFIDDYLIGYLSGISRKLHIPEKYPDNPVLTGDQPWKFGALMLMDLD